MPDSETQGTPDREPALSLEDLEARARALLSPTAYDHYAGGAEDEVTLSANREAYQRWRFRFRVLTGGSRPDLSVDLYGNTLSLPILLAPTATHGLAHPDGELATARGAARAGTIFCLSTLASRTIEDVAGAAEGPRWFQLYVYRDRGLTGGDGCHSRQREDRRRPLTRNAFHGRAPTHWQPAPRLRVCNRVAAL